MNEIEEYKQRTDSRDLSQCHYYKARRAGDEIMEWCDLSDHPCMVAYGDYGCEESNESEEEL